MAHVRTQIRDAVVAKVTGLTTTGPRVWNARATGTKWSAAELPGLNVLTPTDVREPALKPAERKVTRKATVSIEIRVKDDDQYAGTADKSSAEIEAALMGGDWTLGGLLKQLWLERTSTAISNETDQTVVIITQEWAAVYRINETDPETAVT